MLKTIGVLALISYSVALKAAPTATTLPVVIGDDIAKRVCYYQDQAYSEGAVILVGEVYLSCQRVNDFETNGPLKWLPLNGQTSEATKPKLVHP
ncbi:YnjH family protein [Vibrio mimicus]|nr:YnjH family protein [Vibrio mimicus]